MYIFDRYFKYFINKICAILLIVILILLAFFLGLNSVSAAEISYSSADYQVKKCSVLDNSCTKTNPINFGTSELFEYQYLDVLYFNTYGNNNIIFKEGNTYTFTYIVAFNPKYDFELYDFNKSTIYWYGNTSASDSPLNSTYISNGSLKVDNITTGDFSNYQVRFTFSFAPTTDIKYTHFIVDFPNFQCGVPDGTCPYAMNSVRVVSLNILEETGISAAIQNQTNILINNQNQNTNDIINNQNQNTDKVVSEQEKTNEKLDELNDNITSDNTSGGESEGSSFFNDFEVNDNGGISGIITSPLRVINKMLDSNTCENLTFNLNFLGKNKQVSLPSGCILWNKAPQTAVTIYQTLLCGLFSYILATNLFKDIEKLKNPKESEVDTLDL